MQLCIFVPGFQEVVLGSAVNVLCSPGNKEKAEQADGPEPKSRFQLWVALLHGVAGCALLNEAQLHTAPGHDGPITQDGSEC